MDDGRGGGSTAEAYGDGGDGDGLPDRLVVLQKLAAAVRPTAPERAGNLYSQAAELATGRGRGKLAVKLGALAEEAWGEMEEEGEGAGEGEGVREGVI